MIIPTAEPFFLPGGKTGCLLVHGFTGAPKEMRWLGEYLNRQGYSVVSVRLAGHATTPEDLARMQWEDWITSIEYGYFMLRGVVDRIFVIGLSMGGILSLTFATRHEVSGVVTMSVPYKLPDDPRLPFIRLLSPFIRWIKQGPDDFHNKAAAADHVCYPYFPVKSIIELGEVLGEMRKCLPKVTVPVLVIHSRRDAGVPAQNAEEIFSALGSQQKQILWLENSGHVIPREPDREIAFKAIGDFIKHTMAVNNLS